MMLGPSLMGRPGQEGLFRWFDVCGFAGGGSDIRAAGSGQKGDSGGDKGKFHLWNGGVVSW